MHRNKLPFIFAVALFAFMFITGLITSNGKWEYASVISIAGQVGLGASIILYFIIPDKNNTDKTR